MSMTHIGLKLHLHCSSEFIFDPDVIVVMCSNFMKGKTLHSVTSLQFMSIYKDTVWDKTDLHKMCMFNS